MNKILLHICCGPCAIMPLKRLQQQGFEVTGYFYNPNIHPLTEYSKRREGALEVAQKYKLELILPSLNAEYSTAAWLKSLPSFDNVEAERCNFCWQDRLLKTAQKARSLNFDFFSSTLLYSKYQDHQRLQELGEAAAHEAIKPAGANEKTEKSAKTLAFFYEDFRKDWQAGIELSEAWGIYRQAYCGCIFSENQRYQKKLAASKQS